jgi:riboflavin kinase/FMN adenylyltransferase
MQIHEGLADFPSISHAVVTSGTFDGVHLGHQKILHRLSELARKNKGETVLLTYWPHPRLVLYPKEHHLRLLSTFEEKVELLRGFGIDHLIKLPFTQEFSQMSSVDFIQQILVEKIHNFVDLGGNSQNFLSKFVRFCVTFGLKILRLLRPKVVFEADIIKR